MPLYFKFSGSRVPAINRDWLASLMASANGSQGLIVTSEDTYDKQPSNNGTSTESKNGNGPVLDSTELIVSQADIVTVADPEKRASAPVA